MFTFSAPDSAVNFGPTLIKVKISKVPLTPLGTNLKTKEYRYPLVFKNIAEEIRDFKVREDDVWIFAKAKSGITWTQEMVWLIMNNFDFKAAKSLDLFQRTAFLEMNGVLPDAVEGMTPEDFSRWKSPRVVKSHLPADLLPTDYWRVKPKTIFISRNVKDVIVSHHSQYRRLGSHPTMENIIDAYVKDEMMGTPYWETLLDFWQMRNEEHMLFLRFEEMKKDLSSVITKCCEFLGKSIDSVTMEKMLDHLSFESMKVNPSIQNNLVDRRLPAQYDEDGDLLQFVNKGKVGGYKEKLNDKQIQRINEWSMQRIAEGYCYEV